MALFCLEYLQTGNVQCTKWTKSPYIDGLFFIWKKIITALALYQSIKKDDFVFYFIISMQKLLGNNPNLLKHFVFVNLHKTLKIIIQKVA